MTVTLRAAEATDVGRVRTNNEDASLVLGGVFAVADGMGGHRAGEVASHLAIEAMENAFTSAEARPSVDELVESVRRANVAIIEESLTNPERRGMGTTITALAPIEVEGEETLAVLNVGDSRTYRLHDGELEQLTEDHSLVQEMVRDGRLSPEEATVHPQRNIVTRALGVEPDLDVDLITVTPYTGDRFLLASDGLFDEISDSDIAGVLRRAADPEAAAAELVRLAVESGGRDNVTVVVVDVVDDGGRAESASAALDGDKTVALPVMTASPAAAEPAGAPDVAAAADDASTETPAPPGTEAGEPPARRRRITWRVALFGMVILLIGVVAAAAIWWQARNTFYVGFDDGEVAVFRGRAGGVLWFEPTVEESTGIRRSEVPAARRRAIEDGVERSSLAGAQAYVEGLEDEIERATTTTTTSTTTTTTTTRPPTTTAPPPAP
jgi:PPM family protein phosphatase